MLPDEVPVCHSDEHTRGGDLTVARVRSLLNFLKGKHSGHWHYGPGTGPVTVALRVTLRVCAMPLTARGRRLGPGRRGEARRGEARRGEGGAMVDSDSHGALLKRRLFGGPVVRSKQPACFGHSIKLPVAACHHPVRQRGRGVGWARLGVHWGCATFTTFFSTARWSYRRFSMSSSLGMTFFRQRKVAEASSPAC